MQKAPELVVHERMSQGKGVKCSKEKKKVKRWSNEEKKGKPSSSSVEDTEEIIKFRGLKNEIDPCWTNLAERMEEEVLDNYKVEDSRERLTKAEAPRCSGGVCAEARNIGWESGEKIAGQESSPCSESTTCSGCKARKRIRRKKKR